MRASTKFAFLALAILVASALLGAFAIHRSVREALDAPDGERRPLQFVAVVAPASEPSRWGGAEVEGVVLGDAGLIAAGGSGVFTGAGRMDAGLPAMKASALALWRGRPVVALARGGLFRRADGRWEELRSGFGMLHVRALVETPAGELLVGAREGLFRTAWGEPTLARLDAHPVRAIAAGSGFVLAGGEDGLHRVEASRVLALDTPDPWVEAVALVEERAFVVTAVGLASGPPEGPFAAVPGGGDVVTGIAHDGRFLALGESGDGVRRFDARGGASEELLPSPARRLFEADGTLMADTRRGLLRRAPGGWLPALAAPASLPPGPSHVAALAWLGDRLVAGFFDGGLAVATPARDGSLEWRSIPGASAWGVNALLPAGGALYVASLRGAARFDGARLTPIEGPGAAFSLAATPDGVAIGYAQGVLLPGMRLLSAFHGLPGNQALALASGPSLFVGTPSGLGAIEARRVAWRVTPGEGKLPNPWVTALASAKDGLFVGTYGGGVARRSQSGRFEAYVETEGFKVSAGALVEAGGRLYLGTENRGLHRLSPDRARFVPVRAALPSPVVTALAPAGDALYVGTDEGVARLPLPADVAEERQ